jgi:hypothetical protein
MLPALTDQGISQFEVLRCGEYDDLAQIVQRRCQAQKCGFLVRKTGQPGQVTAQGSDPRHVIDALAGTSLDQSPQSGLGAGAVRQRSPVVVSVFG